MRKLLTVLAVLASAVAVTVSPAGAVTGNFTKDFEHNYVVLIAFYDADGTFLWRCSGSLLNEHTVLTAGHCTDTGGGATQAIVWASQTGGSTYDPATGQEAITGYPDRCNPAGGPCATAGAPGGTGGLIEYGYVGGVFLHGDNKDVGLVILDTPIVLEDGYAVLAEPGSVDNLGNGTEVTYSGYGVSDEKPAVVSYRERLMATGFIINTHNQGTAGFNIQLSTNPGKGRGGSCFGDSGGPILYGDVVVGVNSFVKNGQCAGQGFAYRTDQIGVYNWILANAKGDLQTVQL